MGHVFHPNWLFPSRKNKKKWREKKSVKRGKPENSIELGKSKKVKFNFSIQVGAFVQKHSFKMSFRCKQSVVFGEMNFHTRWSFNESRFQFEAFVDCLHNTMGVLVCCEQMKSQFNLGLSYWIRAIIEKQNNWFGWCEQFAKWLNKVNGFVCFDYSRKTINVALKGEFLCNIRESFQVAEP